MLIEELLGAQLVLERGDIDLQHDVEDILLRAERGNIEMLGLSDIIGELNHLNTSIYLDPRDEAFKQSLVDVLEQNALVDHIDPSTGSVVLRKPGDMQSDMEEPESEVDKEQDKQHDKSEKIAMKNVRQGDNSEL